MKTLLKAWGSVIVLILVAFAIADGFFIYLTDKRASPELIHGLGEIVGALGVFRVLFLSNNHTNSNRLRHYDLRLKGSHTILVKNAR